MNSYTDVGLAHAELMLITCSRKENPQGNKNLFLPVRHLWSSLLPPVPQNDAGVSQVLEGGGEERRAVEQVSCPPELSQYPSLHHPLGGFS
jgi:hypothetical protein